MNTLNVKCRYERTIAMLQRIWRANVVLASGNVEFIFTILTGAEACLYQPVQHSETIFAPGSLQKQEREFM